MKYCLDTNAVIAICKSTSSLERFTDYSRKNYEDSFFIPSYVADEFVEGDSGNAQYLELISLPNVEVGEDHFFTIGISMLGGPDILAGGSSEYQNIGYSEEDYKKSGSKKDYWTWRKRKINDRLISEMAESRQCDGIVSENLKDFSKIPSSYDIKVITMDELMSRDK